jgi:hypothetical protein
MLEHGYASEDEMVLCFLKADIDSPKWGPYYDHSLQTRRLDRASLIVNADLTDGSANSNSGKVLGDVRGYGRDDDLFRRFPNDTKWRRLSIDPSEFGSLKYINSEPFLELSANTRSVLDGAQNVKNSPADLMARIDRVVNDDSAAKLFARINDAAKKVTKGLAMAPLILVEDTQKKLTIVEGNTRATAFAIVETKPIPAIVGSAPGMKDWPFI